MSVQMGHNFGRIVVAEAKADVIHIATLITWTCTTQRTKLPRQRDQIDQTGPGAKVDQTDSVVALLDAAPEDVTVKRNRKFGVGYAQNNVVDSSN